MDPKIIFEFAFTGEVLKTTVLSKKTMQLKKPSVEEHLYIGTYCVGLENIHTHVKDGHWKF